MSVTTFGHTQYTRASLCTVSKVKQKPVMPAISLPVPKIASSSKICEVLIEQVPQGILDHHDLLRTRNGDAYRFVQKEQDSDVFAVFYTNVEFKRAVPLGRFRDDATAALAHAIARDDEMCRITPFAAQDRIESIFSPDPLPVPTTVPEKPLDDSEMFELNDVDFDSLFH